MTYIYFTKSIWFNVPPFPLESRVVTSSGFKHQDYLMLGLIGKRSQNSCLKRRVHLIIRAKITFHRPQWVRDTCLWSYSPGVTCVVAGSLRLVPFSATSMMSYKRPASSCWMWAEFWPTGTVISWLLPSPSAAVTVRRYLSISPFECSHWTTADVEVVLTTWRLVGPEMTEDEHEDKEKGHKLQCLLLLPGNMWLWKWFHEGESTHKQLFQPYIYVGSEHFLLLFTFLNSQLLLQPHSSCSLPAAGQPPGSCHRLHLLQEGQREGNV